MRAPMTLLLLACGANAPPLEAHERAFEGERAELRIGALVCNLPMEQLVSVELRFEHATLFLEAAPMGASPESLADDEAETLRLTTGAEHVERRVVFVGARRAIALAADTRQLPRGAVAYSSTTGHGASAPFGRCAPSGSSACGHRRSASVQSLVAMTDPWRVLRTRGERIPELGTGPGRLGEFAFVPPGRFLGGTLRGRTRTIELASDARRCE